MVKVVADKIERLDKFLAENLGKSRSKIQKLIKDGQVTVGGKVMKEADHPLEMGAEIELPEIKDFEFAPSKVELKIVFENNDLMVVDKPSGLLVHPGAGKTEDSLSHALLSYFPGIKGVGEAHRPGIVHRLDEDTSGLIVVAKTPTAYESLKRQFLEHEVEKIYIALVHGVPQKLHEVINLPVSHHFIQRKMRIGGRDAKEAITEYSVVAQGGDYLSLDQVALVRVKLHTGRTHQIRVHMAHIGHPLVGDQLYGGKYKNSDPEIIKRQFLHAQRLKFKLLDGTSIELTSPLPQELTDLLNKVKISYEDSSI